MGDPKTAATGAVMRIDTLQRYAAEAGFGSVEVLPIDDAQVAVLPPTPLSKPNYRAGVLHKIWCAKMIQLSRGASTFI